MQRFLTASKTASEDCRFCKKEGKLNLERPQGKGEILVLFTTHGKSMIQIC